MKPSTSQKIKTGGLVIAGVAFLFLLVFLIGRQKSLFASTVPIYATFKNVAGLQIGNNVRFAGINSGAVDNITIINDTTVRVDLVLEKKITPFVKTDSKVSIGGDGLMGDKLITIGSGSDSGTTIKNGSQLIGVNPMEMDKVISKIAGNAQVITSNLADILTKANNGKGSLGRLLNDDKLVNNLESTIAEAKTTVKTVNTAAANANQGIEAAKHNFLLKGYFNKKEKNRLKDSTAKADAKKAASDLKKSGNKQ